MREISQFGECKSCRNSLLSQLKIRKISIIKTMIRFMSTKRSAVDYGYPVARDGGQGRLFSLTIQSATQAGQSGGSPV